MYFLYKYKVVMNFENFLTYIELIYYLSKHFSIKVFSKIIITKLKID